jgi:hypothetical protein
MKSKSMERDELLSQIHGQRFKVMQHYLLLYGDRLDGKPCLYDKYNAGQLVGTQDEACYKALLVTQQEELKLASMFDRLQVIAA